jgi:eukaryotic-like serine/threonine-protein kinase
MEEITPGTILSRYRIVSKIGAGGMGDVYLAEDTQLDRKVALKILAGDFALDSDRMIRFIQEAKAASALNHPNIITIYEIGETGARHFIAMEFIEGETLQTRLRRGPLPASSVVEAGMQIASALQAAHEANIVHRDIKPENVMVRRDGLIKLLDFGIAKIVDPVLTTQVGGADDLTTIKAGVTSPGVIIGTVAYMSPEQAKGEVIDARTDIFSLGVVLYETLTGRKPFHGAGAMDLIVAIVSREPQSIRELMPDTPPELEEIVDKLLKKNSGERYQTARDVLAALKEFKQDWEFQNKLTVAAPPAREQTVVVDSAITSVIRPQTNSSAEYLVSELKKRKFALAALAMIFLAAAAVFYFAVIRRSQGAAENLPISSIAVLPFQNRNADQETEYLADGLAESLIFGLSQLPDLKVSPTSLVFRYKGKEVDPIAIGGELGVNAVMTGRVAQRGDDLAISVELVDVRTKKLLWGKQYDRKLVDLLSTQREIATEITQNLKLKLSGADERVTRHYSRNSEAYQLYLKGHYYASRYTKEGFNKGIEYFDQAVAKDPNFALAYSGLAFCYMNQTDWVFAPRDSVPKARQALTHALRIDETLAEAHTMNAMILLQYDWNWVEAEREFRRALELDPNYSLGRSFLAWHLAAMGRFDESIAEDKRALELDPLSAAVNADLGWDLYLARRYDEGIDQLSKAVDLEPNYWVSHMLLGRCYEQKGRLREAVEQFEKARNIESSIPEVLAALGHGYALSGRRAEALKIIRDLQERSKKEFVPSFSIATIYLGLGMKEEALQNIEKSYSEGSFYMIHLKVEPILDPIRSEPRFINVMRKVGHVPAG